MRGIVFSPESDISQKIKNSSEFKSKIKKIIRGNENSLSFDSDDLFGSLHKVTIAEVKEHLSGAYQIILFDVYDFAFDKDFQKNPFWVSVNNAAWLLQSTGDIKNYYSIIPVNLSKEETNKLKKLNSK